MTVSNKDKKYFKKLGKIIKQINKERLLELSKMSPEERAKLIFEKGRNRTILKN